MTENVPEPVPPGVPPDFRLSDDDRERAVAFLRHHCTAGRLTLDEFSDRVGDVYAARTAGEVEKVVGDLPVAWTPPAPTPQTARDLRPDRQRAGAASPQRRTRRAVRWTLSIMGANQHRGRWRVEGETIAVSVMGSCRLDLREAEVVGSEVVITAIAFMGDVRVIVPEGIEVILEGGAFMGANHRQIRDVPTIPGSPVVRVRAFSLMGGVKVQSRGERSTKIKTKSKDRGRDRDERRAERNGRRPDRYDRPPLPAGIDALATSVFEKWSELRSRVAPDGTVTIMFSDIEGFTSTTERIGDRAAQELLRDHYAIVRNAIAEHGGFEVKAQGDGFMLAFSSASRALRCAIAIQQATDEYNRRSGSTDMRVRIGLHTGEAIRNADDFLGTTVNTASRIASSARGGEILVSALLRELCAATGEFAFDGGTEVELRGLSQPQRVHSVAWE